MSEDISTPEQRARAITDTIIDAVEHKVRAGDWVSVDAIRRELHKIISSYENQIDYFKHLALPAPQQLLMAAGIDHYKKELISAGEEE